MNKGNPQWPDLDRIKQEISALPRKRIVESELMFDELAVSIVDAKHSGVTQKCLREYLRSEGIIIGENRFRQLILEAEASQFTAPHVTSYQSNHWPE